MKVELSPKEAALIQFAIVSTDELWKPCETHSKLYEPKDELVKGILDKMAKIQEASELNVLEYKELINEFGDPVCGNRLVTAEECSKCPVKECPYKGLLRYLNYLIRRVLLE